VKYSRRHPRISRNFLTGTAAVHDPRIHHGGFLRVRSEAAEVNPLVEVGLVHSAASILGLAWRVALLPS
jgi:hypothetical protein